MRYFGGAPGERYPADFWAQVYALYETSFPGLPAGIQRAEAVGVPWPTNTTPFTLFDGDEAVSHVGVLMQPMRLGGEDRLVAGFHAVCTRPSHRGRGLARRLLAEACAFADARTPLSELSTDDPPIYTGHGFRVTQTYRFVASPAAPSSVVCRPLRPSSVAADLELLRGLLRRRAPASSRWGTLEPGWLVLTDAALSRRADTVFWSLPEHDAVIAWEAVGDDLHVLDVIAARLPPREVILGALPPTRGRVLWSFAPDLLDPEASPEPVPAANGAFMTRGPWPSLGPIGVSPLWEH
ncbi:GNAT family N-acetyltransferase [Myxococcota bacterium]|nr:GNAT family N-acetyltransferase [Myxococcota bacterium]